MTAEAGPIGADHGLDLAAIHQACWNYIDAYEDHFQGEVGPSVLGSLIAKLKEAVA